MQTRVFPNSPALFEKKNARLAINWSSLVRPPPSANALMYSMASSGLDGNGLPYVFSKNLAAGLQDATLALIVPARLPWQTC